MSRETACCSKRARIRLLPPASSLKVVLSILRGHASVVNPTASPAQLARIPRRVCKAPHPLALRISYLQGGTPGGQRVLWIHGTPGRAQGWADYLLDIPSGRNYVALDRPGHGASQPETALPSLALQALALQPLLDCRTGSKTIIVGHSLGASVALQAALDYPQSLGGLLLLAGAFDPACEEIHWVQPLIAGADRYASFRSLFPRPLAIANRELLALKQSLEAMTHRLHEITIPVTIVHGDRDSLVPITNLAYLRQRLVNAPLHATVLANRDHFLPWRCKPAVDKALEHLIQCVVSEN